MFCNQGVQPSPSIARGNRGGRECRIKNSRRSLRRTPTLRNTATGARGATSRRTRDRRPNRKAPAGSEDVVYVGDVDECEGVVVSIKPG
jgi:hypothetical protein